MANTLVHPAAVTVTEADVIANEAYPLVRELAHVYGLQVIHMETTAAPKRGLLYLAREDGICVGYAKFDSNDGYVLRNVMVRKERGNRSQESYWTYFSNKLPYLMRLIKKEKLIPSSSDEVLIRDELMLTGIPNSYSQQFGDTRKQVGINGGQEHTLLEIAFGNRSMEFVSQELIEIFKARLDKFRSLDTMKEKRRNYLHDILDKELWVIGYDETRTYMVGKVKIAFEIDDDSYVPATFKGLQITENFRRCKDLREITEVMPKMTMLRIHAEQTIRDLKVIDGVMPLVSGAVPELDVVAFRNGSTWYEFPLKPSWLVFPCDS